MYYDDDWIAAELAYATKREEQVFKNFMNENDIKDIFAYSIYYSKHTVKIYTRRPGIWIGRAGKTVGKLEEYLGKELYIKNCKVEFCEISGHFISNQ